MTAQVNLAAALLAAATDTFAAEAAVVDLLYKVLPGWQILFPARRSWLWTPPDRIDVWNVTINQTAIRALLHAGFVGGVMLHNHRAERFLSCDCKLVRPTPKVDPRAL